MLTSCPRDMAMALIIWSSSDMLRSCRDTNTTQAQEADPVRHAQESTEAHSAVRTWDERSVCVCVSYSDSSAQQRRRVCEQVLGGLLHGAGVEQGLHGVLPGETHVHQLEAQHTHTVRAAGGTERERHRETDTERQQQKQ